MRGIKFSLANSHIEHGLTRCGNLNSVLSKAEFGADEDSDDSVDIEMTSVDGDRNFEVLVVSESAEETKFFEDKEAALDVGNGCAYFLPNEADSARTKQT